MGKITPFRTKKQKNKEMIESGNTGRIDYKEKIRNHRFTILYRVGLIAVLVLAVLAAWYYQWKHRVYTDCLLLQSVESNTIQSNALVEFAGNILVYGKDGASCVDTKGNPVWNVTYEMQNPLVVINGNVVAIGDFNSRKIYMMDAKGSIGEITTTMPIYKFCVSQNGVLAVALNDSDVTWIYLYNTLGEQLAYFKTTMQKSGYPLALSISPNGQLVGVSFLYLDNGEMKTSVAFYNFGGVGQNKTDNYVSGYNYQSEVVPCLEFMDAKTAFAVSDSRLMFYSGNQVPVSSAEHLVDKEILSVFHNEEYVGLVFGSDDPDYRYRLDIYNKDGQIVISKDFNLEYKDILIKGKYVYIYNEASSLIFTLDDITKFDGKLDRSALLLVPGDSINKLTVVSTESIDSLELN